MTLHLELNKIKENNEFKNYGNIDQTNKKTIFEIFEIYNKEVISKNNSIYNPIILCN